MRVLPQRADETGLTLRTAAPMFAADPGFQIVLWNDGAERLLGFTNREVLGRPCFEVLGCPQTARRLCCGARPGAEERVPSFDLEASTRSGEPMWVNVATLFASSGDGAPLRVHFLHELDRQRQLEELLREVLSAASKLSARRAGPEGRGARAPAPIRSVTGRERDVLRLLAQGRSTAAIAAELGIAPRTARNHVQNILCKLRVHSRLEAVAYASARGLV